ncbi:MAG: GIY-YIG nuclease family protein [Chloroflexi bacterium]|nr:GIY-YIG nuclease family protein [Chloroflexota bacterium]OJV91336.1 MAG: hypothetical protein BGO39_27230 [Chloroflexi bacterium 54-19]
MNRRKELLREFKERKPLGGVYRIVNEKNERYILDHAANIKSIQNRFEFALKNNSLMDYKMKKDWDEQGGKHFKLEILEEVEQREDQTPAQFMDELKTLEGLYRANFDPAKEY